MSTGANGNTPLKWDVFVANRQGLTRDLPPGKEELMWVPGSATLIYGEKDAVLVDTLLTVEQATALVEWVAAHGKNVTTIYVTHGHGDHFFGLGAVLDGVWRDCRCRGVSSYLSISMGSLVWRCHFSFTHSARKTTGH